MLIFGDPCYQKLAQAHAPDYQTGDPFPHVVLDEFLPESVAGEILEKFPDRTGVNWIRFHDHTGVKLGSLSETAHGGEIYELLQQFNSAPILRFLEMLTGIKGIIPDPYFVGGGLHQIERDGFLKVHADFNRHEDLRLDRRINLLLYLNRDWKEEYGGHLELWDRSMSQPVKRILPIFNRCVIFNTTDWAYHGHPKPLVCPENMTRKSIATYYYTSGRPEDETTAPHSTLYQTRPQDRARLALFRNRSRVFLADTLEGAARFAQKPATLLRIIAGRVRPPTL